MKKTSILPSSSKAESSKDLKNKSKSFMCVVQNCISITQEFFQCGIFDEMKEIIFNILEKKTFTEEDKTELEFVFSIAADPLKDFETEYKRIE